MAGVLLKFCVSIFIFAGCTQSTESEIVNLTGERIWIQSTGGFAGQTLNPESENKTQKFILREIVSSHIIEMMRL